MARISPDGSPEPSPVSSPVTPSIADSIRRAEVRLRTPCVLHIPFPALSQAASTGVIIGVMGQQAALLQSSY